MTGTTITIAVRDDDIRAVLAGVVARARNLRVPFAEIGAALVTSALQRFEAQRDPTGTAWKPLAPSTLRAKKRALRAKKRPSNAKPAILADSGDLRRSINFRASADGVSVGTNVPYAAIHQFGGLIAHQTRRQTVFRKYDAKSGELSGRFSKAKNANFASDHWVAGHVSRIPARPFLGLEDADREHITSIIREHLLDAAGRSA